MPPVSASEDEEASFSEASWDDVDEQDFLNDIEASDLEEGEEGEESEPERSNAKPKPKLDPQPPKVILRKHVNGVNGSDGASAGGATHSRAPNNIVGKRLKPPAVVQVSCKMLFDQIESGEIDLDAEYQRDVVWPEKYQSKLIDSIFRNYYIPPVVFSRQEKEMQGGELQEVKICVDGKQRLTSIWKFMSGEIPFLDKKTKYKYFWNAPPTRSKTSRTLSDEWKKEFMRAQITTVGFMGLEPAEERDIFQRVQMGMVLSTPEKWQALQGPWPDFLRDLRGSFFNQDVRENNILAHIPWDASRAKDFQDLVRMAFLVNSIIVVRDGSAPPVGTEKLGAALSSEEGPSDQFRQTMMMILVTFKRLVTEPRHKFAFEGKVAPVELVMIAILIGQCQGLATDGELAQGIRSLRDKIRANTAKGYLMWKPEVVRKMLKYIKEWRSEHRQPDDRTAVASDKSRAVILRDKASAPKKRKAVETNGDSSGDEPPLNRNVRPKPSASTPTMPKKSREAPNGVKTEPGGSSLKIGGTNVATPQRVELPPMVSRESWKNPGGTPSTMPSVKQEERSPVEPRPSARAGSNSISPVVPAAAASDQDPMQDLTLDQQIELVNEQLAALSDLLASGDRPDKLELEARRRQQATLKTQLKSQWILRRRQLQAGGGPTSHTGTISGQ